MFWVLKSVQRKMIDRREMKFLREKKIKEEGEA